MRKNAPAAICLLLLAAPGCALEEDEAASETDELRRKVAPKATASGLELVKPPWLGPEFRSGIFLLNGPQLGPGTFTALPPSHVTLMTSRFEEGGQRGGDPRYPVARSGSVWDNPQTPLVIEAGKVTKYSPAGLVLRYAAPVSGSAPLRVGLTRLADPTLGQPARDAASLTDATVANGFSIALLDGTYRLDTSADPTPKTFNLVQGGLTVVSLPVTRIRVTRDAPTPGYVDHGACARYRFEHASGDPKLSGDVRFEGTGPVARGALPAGPAVRLVIDGCGVDRERIEALAPNKLVTIRTHRLEVDDLEVTGVDGTKTRRRAQVTILRKTAAGYVPIPGGQTPLSVEVLDGTYRVDTEVPGHVRAQDEVSFP